MFETLLITFREGLEAFLIVAITVAYLAKTNRKALTKPVYWGVFVALIISATTGWHIAGLADTPLMEGILAIIAGVLVASMTIIVMKGAKNIKATITNKLETQAQKTGWAAVLGIFIFTVIMIAREGMETALLLGAIAHKTDATGMMLGGVGGIVLTAFIGYLWISQSNKINLRLFMQVTGIFLILFAVHLFLYGIYELTEVEGTIFYNEALHVAMKPWVSTKQLFGQLTIYGLLVVPCTWLIASYAKDKFFTKNQDFTAAE